MWRRCPIAGCSCDRLITNSIEDSPWAAQLRFDIESAKVVFFIGYSLFDLDIKRIIFEDIEKKEKTFFVVKKDPEKPLERRIGRFGTILPIGVDGFAQEVKNERSNFTPPSTWTYRAHSYAETFPPSVLMTPTSDDVFSLLFLGDLKEALIGSSFQAGDNYFLKRDYIGKILDDINNNRIVCLHSFLGNGKTLLIEGLKYFLKNQGHSVFSILKRRNSTLSETREILKKAVNPVFIFDGYPEWIKEIRFLGDNAPKNTKFVFASRTTSHDLYLESLQEIFSDRDVREYQVDKLGFPEIERIRELLQSTGLWGEFAGESLERKNSFLQSDCSSEFHGILLKLLKSPSISSRLEKIVTEINKNQEAAKVLISAFLVSYVGERCTSSMLMDFFGARVNDVSIRSNPGMKEILDQGHSEIRIKSSIAAQHILRKITDRNLAAATIKEIVKSCDKNLYTFPYRSILKKMMRFGFLQDLFNDQKDISLILSIYDEIKDVPYCNSNPQFWLQFAIACLANREFSRSEIFFNSAYSIARKIAAYDLYQIDNHYSRLLLLKATEVEAYPDCLVPFRSALPILSTQMKRERRKYPFKVATYCHTFYEKFQGVLSPSEVEEIKSFSKTVLVAISQLPDYVAKDSWVVEAKTKFQEILK